MSLIGVYCIEHLATGRMYVGKSVDVVARIKAHKRGHKRLKSHLANALRKYGPDAFDYMLLERCRTEADATRQEQHWIRMMDSRHPKGFNQTAGGEGAAGRVLSPELRAKIAASNRGQKRSPETRARVAEAARNISDETRAKMSAAASRRRATDETRAKMAESMRAAHRRKAVWRTV